MSCDLKAWTSAGRKMAPKMTPLQRLDRMRESFARDKSVLAEDYKFFTTPATPTPRVSIPRNKAAHKLVEQPVPKSPKQS
jgi:hypothetical protein